MAIMKLRETEIDANETIKEGKLYIEVKIKNLWLVRIKSFLAHLIINIGGFILGCKVKVKWEANGEENV